MLALRGKGGIGLDSGGAGCSEFSFFRYVNKIIFIVYAWKVRLEIWKFRLEVIRILAEIAIGTEKDNQSPIFVYFPLGFANESNFKSGVLYSASCLIGLRSSLASLFISRSVSPIDRVFGKFDLFLIAEWKINKSTPFEHVSASRQG
uniref:Uncharacterized protein n=1 Tax=Candidatus Kentrum sp. TUN TaxID=2126343 RepID=A0A450ZX38_9GAMM|nr:MAG: hypothetical protein BECKTUN1418D_GA0071000_10814 [Candidatus Kentron sp. TUN]